MKISWFKKVITPELGVHLAGYNAIDTAVMKLDDLFVTGLCVCDNENHKVLLLSYDLLGLDEWYIRKVRKGCAEILGIGEMDVLLSCTHTHSGPQTRSVAKNPELLHRSYMDDLEQLVYEEVRNMPEFQECKPYFYSCQCDENANRRYNSGDNHTTFTPHRREFISMRTGIADQELGALMFMNDLNRPIYVIANYAAHPLAGHSPGLGSLRISADYPGALRDYITSNTGAECMFITGAAGDLVPKEDELGDDAFRSMGIRLGKQVIGGILEAFRNVPRYGLQDVKVGSCTKTFTVPLRKRYCGPNKIPAEYAEKKEVTLEVQCVAIGDICFVGVPGELCNELGLEIKWHSPFRRTFIAYDATAYFSYICPANFLVSGGYEPSSQRFSARGGLKLVEAAVDAMFELRESLYPSGDEPYPDNAGYTLVNILPSS